MILDLIFIFFKMEITGAAIATMLSNLAIACFFLIFLFRIRKSSAVTPSLPVAGQPARLLPADLPERQPFHFA